MNWHTTQIDDTHILTIYGRFDAHGVPAIKGWLSQVTTNPQPQVQVNLGEVHFIDSAALSVLINGLKQCRIRGGQLVVTELSQPVRIIFELTKMDQIFHLKTQKPESLKQLASSPREVSP
jgi:anti-sigma B factor antagonist